jgi:retron-type reverse transcriptase
LGIAALEDKIVQQAVVTILNEIYEVDFKDYSYGSGRVATRTRRWTRWQWESRGSE